ncbi:MAG: ABC transporter substrate-binding protein [Vulcanimicrobiota bacterium]
MKRKYPASFTGSLIIAFSVLFLLTVLPCFSASSSSVTITLWHTMRRGNQEALNELLKKFQKENPDVVVDIVTINSRDPRMGNDYSALYSKLLESIAQKKAPNVAQVYENWTTQFIEIDALVPVDSFKDGLSDKDKQDFFPIFKEANTFNGKLWTLPFNKSIYVLYYNKSLFKAQNLSYPKTWDEVRTTAQKLTNRNGDEVSQYGLVFTPSVDMFGHYLYAHGGEFISGDTAVFANPTGIKDLEFWVQLTNTDRTALPSFNAFDDFVKQKGAMYVDSTSRIGQLGKNCPFEYGIAPMPSGSMRSYQFAGTNLAVFNTGDAAQQNAAWRLVKFLTNTENNAFWAINTGYLPIRQSSAKSPQYQEYLKSHPDFNVALQSLQYAKVQPKNPAWESIRGFINDAMYEAISQTATPSQALEKAATYSNGLLKSMKGKN